MPFMLEWIERLSAFMNALSFPSDRVYSRISIEPPIDMISVERISNSLPIPMPNPIQRFLNEESSNCSFFYHLKLLDSQLEDVRRFLGHTYSVYGGGSLCNVAEFSVNLDSCRGWAEGAISYLGMDQESLSPWIRGFPFVSIGNGDMLAIDVGSNQNESPVVYLNHEIPDQIVVLARNFEQFLRDWEKLCYVMPFSLIPKTFVNPTSGYIDGDLAAAGDFRNLFGQMVKSGQTIEKED